MLKKNFITIIVLILIFALSWTWLGQVKIFDNSFVSSLNNNLNSKKQTFNSNRQSNYLSLRTSSHFNETSKIKQPTPLSGDAGNNNVQFLQQTSHLSYFNTKLSNQNIKESYSFKQGLLIWTQNHIYYTQDNVVLNLTQGINASDFNNLYFIGIANDKIFFIADHDNGNNTLYMSSDGLTFSILKLPSNAGRVLYFNNNYWFQTEKGLFYSSDLQTFTIAHKTKDYHIYNLVANDNMLVAMAGHSIIQPRVAFTLQTNSDPSSVTVNSTLSQDHALFYIYILDQTIYINGNKLWYLSAGTSTFESSDDDWNNIAINNMINLNHITIGYAEEISDNDDRYLFYLDKNYDKHIINTSSTYSPILVNGAFLNNEYYLQLPDRVWLIGSDLSKIGTTSLNTTLQNNQTTKILTVNDTLVTNGDQVLTLKQFTVNQFMPLTNKSPVRADILIIANDTVFALSNPNTANTSDLDRVVVFGVGFYMDVTQTDVKNDKDKIWYYQKQFKVNITNPAFVSSGTFDSQGITIPSVRVETKVGRYTLSLNLINDTTFTCNFEIKNSINNDELTISSGSKDVNFNQNLAAQVTAQVTQQSVNYYGIPIVQSKIVDLAQAQAKITITIKDDILDLNRSYYNQGSITHPKQTDNEFRANPSSKITLSSKTITIGKNGIYLFTLYDQLQNQYHFLVETGGVNWQAKGHFASLTTDQARQIKKDKIQQAFSDGNDTTWNAFKDWLNNYNADVDKNVEAVIKSSLIKDGNGFFKKGTDNLIMLQNQISSLSYEYIAPIIIDDNSLTMIPPPHIKSKILQPLVNDQIKLDKNTEITIEILKDQPKANAFRINIKNGFEFKTKGELDDYDQFVNGYSNYIEQNYEKVWLPHDIIKSGRGYLTSNAIASITKIYPFSTFQKMLQSVTWDNTQKNNSSSYNTISSSDQIKLANKIEKYIDKQYQTKAKLEHDITKAEKNVNYHNLTLNEILNYYQKKLPQVKNEINEYTKVDNKEMSFHNWLVFASNNLYQIKKDHQKTVILYSVLGVGIVLIIATVVFFIVFWPRILNNMRGKKLLQGEKENNK